VQGVGAAAIAGLSLALAGCASTSGGTAAPALGSAFAAVSLPQRSVRLTTGVHQSPLPIDHPGGSRVSYQDWSSPISMNATVAWITAHMAPTWLPGDLNKYNLGRDQEWDGPANPKADGTHLTVTVTAKGNGAIVEVAAWSMPLGGKPAKETLSGVTGATAHVTNDNGSYIKPFSITLTTAQAQRFAGEINALAVEHPVASTGTAGVPDVTLTFETDHGPRAFLAARNDDDVQSLGGGPGLIMSGSLEHELNVDIPKGESSRPATDQHPVLPQDITSATFTTGQEKGLLIEHPAVTGARLRQLVADLRKLPLDPDAGTCTKKGQPQGELVVHGRGEERRFSYSGDCDEVSSETSLDGQIVIPFSASPAFEVDVAKMLSCCSSRYGRSRATSRLCSASSTWPTGAVWSRRRPSWSRHLPWPPSHRH
jgi:hypothetical protein